MSKSTSLREGSLQVEGPLLVSKAIKLPALLDESEMEMLINDLKSTFEQLSLFYVQGLCKKIEGEILFSDFLTTYKEYVGFLKEGKAPPLEYFRGIFSSIMTVSTDILYSLSVSDDKHLIKATKPIVQLQPHHLHYSKEDGEFRSMVFGEDSISWGIQFSYPQLYQDPHTQEIFDVKVTPQFVNTLLFRTLQKWMREHTVATPFLVDGKRINVFVRLGKRCFRWIDCHPQLQKHGIGIVPLDFSHI